MLKILLAIFTTRCYIVFMNILPRLLFIYFVWITPCNASLLKPLSLEGLNITFAALMYLDRQQTEVITRRDNTFYEYNPYLKKHNSIKELNMYFGGITVAAIGISYALPKKYAKIFILALTCTQFTYISNNYSVGVRVFSRRF